MKDVNTIVRLLQQRKIIAVPTESIYGLSCLIDAKVVSQLIAIKKRDIAKGFIIVSGKANHLLCFVNTKKLTRLQIEKISMPCEKPTTWVVPAQDKISWLTGNASNIAIRLSTHPLVKELTNKLDQAIISTSANISGQPPANTAEEVSRYFNTQLGYIYPQTQKPIAQAKPSQIIDLIIGAVLRA